jgi:hypothetical protein
MESNTALALDKDVSVSATLFGYFSPGKSVSGRNWMRSKGNLDMYSNRKYFVLAGKSKFSFQSPYYSNQFRT